MSEKGPIPKFPIMDKQFMLADQQRRRRAERFAATICIVAIVFFLLGMLRGGANGYEQVKQEMENEKAKNRLLQTQYDSLRAAGVVIDLQADSIMAVRDTLQARYAIIKELLYKNNDQLKTYKKKYESLSRYDSISPTGIRQYFADSTR